MSERPTTWAIGQRRRIDEMGIVVKLTHEPLPGLSNWRAVDEVSGEPYAVNPSARTTLLDAPAVSPERPKPAKGQRWRHIPTNDVITLTGKQTPSGAWAAETHDGAFLIEDEPQYFEFIPDVASPPANVPVCRCGKAMVPRGELHERYSWVCMYGYDDNAPKCAKPATLCCETTDCSSGWCAEHAQPRATPMPWPEPTVGSKWDRYVDSKFIGYEYIPHGWDYATKQPRATASAAPIKPLSVTVATAGTASPAPAEMACAMCGGTDFWDHARHGHPFIFTAPNQRPSTTPTVSVGSGKPARREACESCAKVPAMPLSMHLCDPCIASRMRSPVGLAVCLIDLEANPAPLAESKRYPMSGDPDSDIPDAWRVWR